MMEAELAKIAALDALREPGLKIRCSPEDTTRVKVVLELANYVPELLAEVHRLRKCQIEEWCPGLPVACQKHVDQQAHDVFERTVEIDNLRKMLADSKAREQQLTERITTLRRILPPEPPVPMCRPDALEDLFPEGRPT